MKKLHVPIDLNGEPMVILMSQMAALPDAALGEVVGSAKHLRDEMISSVDLLVTGF